MVYLDNIIIYLNSKQEHKEYIKQVLKRLYKEDMPIIIKKCKFYTRKTNFIEFIIKWLNKPELFIRITKKNKNQKQEKE